MDETYKALVKQIEMVLEDMSHMISGSEEHEHAAKTLQELYRLKIDMDKMESDKAVADARLALDKIRANSEAEAEAERTNIENRKSKRDTFLKGFQLGLFGILGFATLGMEEHGTIRSKAIAFASNVARGLGFK